MRRIIHFVIIVLVSSLQFRLSSGMWNPFRRSGDSAEGEKLLASTSGSAGASGNLDFSIDDYPATDGLQEWGILVSEGQRAGFISHCSQKWDSKESLTHPLKDIGFLKKLVESYEKYKKNAGSQEIYFAIDKALKCVQVFDPQTPKGSSAIVNFIGAMAYITRCGGSTPNIGSKQSRIWLRDLNAKETLLKLNGIKKEQEDLVTEFFAGIGQ